MKKWRINVRFYKTHSNAVSDIVGTAVMLAIAVAVFSVIYSMVLSQPIPQTPPEVTLVGTVEGNNIVIEHRGGKDLNTNTEITITIGGTTKEITVGDYLDQNAKQDGKWSVGERVYYPFTYDPNTKEAEITAVDVDNNALVMMGTLDIHPECDIGVKITVDNTNPKIFDIIHITITATYYRGDLDNVTGVQVKYLLPVGLTHDSHTSSQGSYNNNTGIWDVGKLETYSSATLIINANVTAIGHSAPTQLVCILDGSTSITDQNWSTFTHGLADAIKSSSFPHDGSVELTIIQFGGQKSSSYYNARIECGGPRIVTDANYSIIANSIWTNENQMIQQYTGYPPTAHITSYTPLSCGIRRVNDFLISSANYHDYKHVICLITDGAPNCKGNIYPIGSDAGRYKIDIQPSGDPTALDYSRGKTDAENARTETINNVLKQKDEFDALVIHGKKYGDEPSFPDLVSWLKQSIAWPGNYQWLEDQETPPGPGWVRVVNSWDDFPQAIQKMFNVLFNGISNTVEIVHSTPDDPNMDNNQATLPTIMPHS